MSTDAKVINKIVSNQIHHCLETLIHHEYPYEYRLKKASKEKYYQLKYTSAEKVSYRNFPGSLMVKNLPANSEDAGWSLVRELRSHKFLGNQAHAPRAHALQQENPPQWEARSL